MDRVTRFGKISPLWQKLNSLWQFNEGLFGIWRILLPTSANFVYNWANFVVVNVQIMNTLKATWSHCVWVGALWCSMVLYGALWCSMVCVRGRVRLSTSDNRAMVDARVFERERDRMHAIFWSVSVFYFLPETFCT